jgi:hypothetical protein
MATFTKQNSNILITKFDITEMYALLKFNVKMVISFLDKDNKVIEYIFLKERTHNGNTNLIEISTQYGKSGIVGYDYLTEYINQNLPKGKMVFAIEAKEFADKEPLLSLVETIKFDFIENCVFIDYDSKTETYLLMNKPIKNVGPDCLYFFTKNNSALIIGANGPDIIYGKYKSVEELLCA